MKLSQQSKSLLAEVFQTIIDRYSPSVSETVLTDIHFQPVQETGELVVFDDDDEEIARTTIVEWVDATGDFGELTKAGIVQALAQANSAGALEHLSIWKPYSFVLVDDERETVCDLLLVDDDTLIVTEQLMSGLDAELNDFLENLLSE